MFRFDLEQLLVTTTHHAQIVLDDTFAFIAELGFELVLDGFEQSLFTQAGSVLHIRCVEESTLESIALHTQLQVGVAGFGACDLERVKVMHADLVIDDVLLGAHGEGLPHGFGAIQITLDDEHTTVVQSFQGIGVQEYLRIGRHHDVHARVFAVDTDGLGCGG